MSSRTLIEVFGHVVFSFTRGVTEHYNPDEPEYTSGSFGYNPLESTEREWYHQPIDEFIYQEYGREATALDYLASRGVHVGVINACSPEENEERQENEQDDDTAMAWKRLRPSALRTVCKSMHIGALISLLVASFIGILCMPVFYICYNTIHDCQFYREKSIPIKVQWTRTISDIICCALLYVWFFVRMRFLFRPFQLKGMKRQMFLVSFLTYGLDTVYRVALQALGIYLAYLIPTFPTYKRFRSTLSFFLILVCKSKVCYNNSLLQKLKTTKAKFFLSNVYTHLFMSYRCHDHNVLHLSSVQQTK